MLGIPIALVLSLWISDRTGDLSRGDCERIRDSDARHWCRATRDGSSTWCESIHDGDLRHYCRAIVRREASWCSAIRSPEMRSECRWRAVHR